MSKKLATTTDFPAWVEIMRSAAMKSVSEDDVREIIENQVAAAKKGNKDAIKFVMDNILGGVVPKGGTYVQNNFYGNDGDVVTKATDAKPGTRKKLETMAMRARAGLPTCRGDDGGEVNLD